MMMAVESSERIYSIHRPLAAFCAGAAVAVLGGLIGLGGAEFRLPILIAIFELFPQRAVRINLLISLATLLASAVARLGFVHATNIGNYTTEIVCMLAGGILAGWIGAGELQRIPKQRINSVIAYLLIGVAALLITETILSGTTALSLPHDQLIRGTVAILAGLFVGAISSLLGVAGGEIIIPILIFVFGVDIRTAGTASVLISLPIVLTGICRHLLTGHYRSRSMLSYLVLPMSIGSIVGAMAGGYLAAWAPTDAMRIVLAVILAISAVKLFSKKSAH